MHLGPYSTSDLLKYAARRTEAAFDINKRRLKAAVGWRRPLTIQAYRGVGGHREIRVRGRVLEDKPVPEPTAQDAWYENLWAMYRHWQTDEAAGVRVAARYRGVEQTTLSDEEGYFEFRFRPDGGVLRSDGSDHEGWEPVALRLPPQPVRQAAPVTAVADVRVPGPDAAFGVISDMDDTVIRSHATNFYKVARLTLLKNAHTRMPFPGVSAFYRALEDGPDGRSHNPLYYVSSSAWNLHELFRVFLETNDIPRGPILLRDLGVDSSGSLNLGHDHKLVKIGQILDLTGDLPFVLLGDSGQHDPRLYRDAVERFPGRIRAIYIRDVRVRTRREVQGIAREVSAAGVPMRLVPDTVAAARHAAEIGLIDPAAIADVRHDRRADTMSPARAPAA